MSEESGKVETVRIKVAKNASQDEKKAAIGEAYFEQMKRHLVEEYEKRGVELQDPDNMSTEEASNLSQALKVLKEQDREFSGVNEAPRGGETAQLNEAQHSGSYRNYGNERGYNSTEDMIRDLRQQAHDKRDPVKQTEAEAILLELWKKWGRQVKKDFEEGTSKSKVNYEPKTELEQKKSIRKIQKGDY